MASALLLWRCGPACADLVVLSPADAANVTLLTYHDSWWAARQKEPLLPPRLNLTLLSPKAQQALCRLARGQAVDDEASAGVLMAALKVSNSLVVINTGELPCCLEALSTWVAAAGGSGLLDNNPRTPAVGAEGSPAMYQSCTPFEALSWQRLAPMLSTHNLGSALPAAYARLLAPNELNPQSAHLEVRLLLNRRNPWVDVFNGPLVVGIVRIALPAVNAAVGWFSLLALFRRQRPDGSTVLTLSPPPWRGLRFGDLILLMQFVVSIVQAALLAVTGGYAAPVPLMAAQWAIIAPAAVSCFSSVLMAALFRTLLSQGTTSSAIIVWRSRWLLVPAGLTVIVMIALVCLLGSKDDGQAAVTIVISVFGLVAGLGFIGVSRLPTGSANTQPRRIA